MMMLYADVQDETGVAAFTALPRSKWAEIRDRLKQNETNKRSLRLIDSSAAILVLDTSQTDEEANRNVRNRGKCIYTFCAWMRNLPKPKLGVWYWRSL